MAEPLFTYREATADDVPAIVELVESAYRGDSSRAGWTTEADLLGGQRTDPAAIAAIITSASERILLAVSPDGDLLGCCQLAPRADGTCYFGLFAVRPGRQGGGLGHRLLAAAADRAATEWHCTAMEMTVIGQRDDLIAWYERRGYRRTGDTRAFPYGDPRYGEPKRDDLYFEVLAKPLTSER